MGLFDKIREKTGGIATAVEPEPGTEVQPADEVRRRLMAISGKGIETRADGDEVVVSWSAELAGAGVFGAGRESLTREIRVAFDEATHTAAGKTHGETSESGVGAGGGLLGTSKSWGSGKQFGKESEHVISWGGPHKTEGGADESGYSFSWSELRDPVIEAVTGSGWTYRPR